MAAIQAGRDDEDMKRAALASMEKAKTESAPDKAFRWIKSGLGLLKDGAAIWALFEKHGWVAHHTLGG